jgi:hypothetical protein
VTPDHVIAINGRFVAARQATVGASLSAGKVTSVAETTGRIINPVTASGTILAYDKNGGAPVFSSTHPEWIAGFVLAAPTFSLVGTRVASRLAPAATHAVYTAFEDAIATVLPAFQSLTSANPSLLPLGVLAADTTFALSVLVYSLLSSLADPVILTVLAAQRIACK